MTGSEHLHICDNCDDMGFEPECPLCGVVPAREEQPESSGTISPLPELPHAERRVHDADLIGWKLTRQRGLTDGSSLDRAILDQVERLRSEVKQADDARECAAIAAREWREKSQLINDEANALRAERDHLADALAAVLAGNTVDYDGPCIGVQCDGDVAAGEASWCAIHAAAHRG